MPADHEADLAPLSTVNLAADRIPDDFSTMQPIGGEAPPSPEPMRLPVSRMPDEHSVAEVPEKARFLDKETSKTLVSAFSKIPSQLIKGNFGDAMEIATDAAANIIFSKAIGAVQDQGREPVLDRIGIGSIKDISYTAAEANSGVREIMSTLLTKAIDPDSPPMDIRKSDLEIISSLEATDAAILATGPTDGRNFDNVRREWAQASGIHDQHETVAYDQLHGAGSNLEVANAALQKGIPQSMYQSVVNEVIGGEFAYGSQDIEYALKEMSERDHPLIVKDKYIPFVTAPVGQVLEDVPDENYHPIKESVQANGLDQDPIITYHFTKLGQRIHNMVTRPPREKQA